MIPSPQFAISPRHRTGRRSRASSARSRSRSSSPRTRTHSPRRWRRHTRRQRVTRQAIPCSPQHVCEYSATQLRGDAPQRRRRRRHARRCLRETANSCSPTDYGADSDGLLAHPRSRRSARPGGAGARSCPGDAARAPPRRRRLRRHRDDEPGDRTHAVGSSGRGRGGAAADSRAGTRRRVVPDRTRRDVVPGGDRRSVRPDSGRPRTHCDGCRSRRSAGLEPRTADAWRPTRPPR